MLAPNPVEILSQKAMEGEATETARKPPQLTLHNPDVVPDDQKRSRRSVERFNPFDYKNIKYIASNEERRWYHCRCWCHCRCWYHRRCRYHRCQYHHCCKIGF